MNAYKIALLIQFAVSAVAAVALVGRPRQPLTRSQLLFVLIGCLVWSYCVVKA